VNLLLEFNSLIEEQQLPNNYLSVIISELIIVLFFIEEIGQVVVRPFFRLQHFWKKITWLESALNSQQNYVFFFKKKKNFCLWYVSGAKEKENFFSPFNLIET